MRASVFLVFVVSMSLGAEAIWGGSYIGSLMGRIQHPHEYTGEKADITISVCVDSFEQAPELLYPTQLAIEAWNISAGTTNNVKAAGIPEGKIDGKSSPYPT